MHLHDNNTLDLIENLEDTALIRLVYTSKMTIKSRLETQVLSDIQAIATARNQARKITGFLCYGNGNFLQCLEGEKKTVVDLVQSIAKDPRHKEVRIKTAYPARTRYFSDWSMRSIFLERWLWSSDTKKKVEKLDDFLPFKPQIWSHDKTNGFISAINHLQTEPKAPPALISYSALGNAVQQVAGPHQAFIVVQVILGTLATIYITIQMATW